MSRVIEASDSISQGAGVFSISPGLHCAHVVPCNNPAFKLMYLNLLRKRWTIGNEEHLKIALQIAIDEVEDLFHDGMASPFDVDLDGNTLLHVRTFKLAIDIICGIDQDVGSYPGISLPDKSDYERSEGLSRRLLTTTTIISGEACRALCPAHMDESVEPVSIILPISQQAKAHF